METSIFTDVDLRKRQYRRRKEIGSVGDDNLTICGGGDNDLKVAAAETTV